MVAMDTSGSAVHSTTHSGVGMGMHVRHAAWAQGSGHGHAAWAQVSGHGHAAWAQGSGHVCAMRHITGFGFLCMCAACHVSVWHRAPGMRLTGCVP